MHSYNECCRFKVFFFFVILLFPSVVPQTTVILNSDRQNAIVAKMEDPLSNRAPDSLENIISKSVATTPPPPFTANTMKSPLEDRAALRAGHTWAFLSPHGLSTVGTAHRSLQWGGLCHAADQVPLDELDKSKKLRERPHLGLLCPV